ncbi:hypothetical protein ACRBEV_01800 [Methylobacterium phyllosphaerae]
MLTRQPAGLEARLARLLRGSTLAECVYILRQRRGGRRQKFAQLAGLELPAVERLESGNSRIVTLSAVLAVLAPAPHHESNQDGEASQF